MSISYHVRRCSNRYLLIQDPGGKIIEQFKTKQDAQARLYELHQAEKKA